MVITDEQLIEWINSIDYASVRMVAMNMAADNRDEAIRICEQHGRNVFDDKYKNALSVARLINEGTKQLKNKK